MSSRSLSQCEQPDWLTTMLPKLSSPFYNTWNIGEERWLVDGGFIVPLNYRPNVEYNTGEDWQQIISWYFQMILQIVIDCSCHLSVGKWQKNSLSSHHKAVSSLCQDQLTVWPADTWKSVGEERRRPL